MTTLRRTLTVALAAATLLAISPAVSEAPEGRDAPPAPTQKQGPRMDVVFAIDATGSMGDEIEVARDEIWNIATRLMASESKPDLRFGLVFYRDISDERIIETADLTRDVDRIYAQLNQVGATGGGDWREHVGRGLHEALDLDWDLDAKTQRMIFLVGDAPGQPGYDDAYGIDAATDEAVQKGIVIHVIGGSGLDSGRAEMEAIAHRTDGVFRFLTYHAVVEVDGQQRSVIHHGGETYEADEVLSKEEWGEGAESLLKKGKLKKARKKVKDSAPAPGRGTSNNLDAEFEMLMH